METITTQIKEAESMECTVEIVVHYYYFFQFEKHFFEKQMISTSKNNPCDFDLQEEVTVLRATKGEHFIILHLYCELY